MKRAIIYVRVSTDEQAEKGYSLSHQEECLRKYCLMNNVEIVAFYREDYSAKTFERPEFTKLLAFIRKNKTAADSLLFLKWDRFSRNAPEAYAMISMLHKLGVEPQAIEQPLNFEIPEHKFLLAMYLTAPEVENDRRALNVIAGIRKAMKEGRYMGSAPYGYKHARDNNNRPCIAPNPKQEGFVRTAFELMATGNYHIEHLRHIMNAKGMNITRSRFWCLLRNPAYIGKIVIPAYKQEPLMIVKGNHERIISDALFYEAQDALEGRKRNQPAVPFVQKEELPLRGYLMCPKCGKTLTGSSSKGRSARYVYYHCSKGCPVRFKAEEANEAFSKLLKSISGNKKLFSTYALVMRDAAKKKGTDKTGELQQLTKELETYKKRLDNAQTLMLDGQLDASDYRGIKAKIEPEMERSAAKISGLDSNKVNERDVIEFGFYFLNNMDKLFTSADLERKRLFLGSTFPEKLIYENKVYRTTNPDNPLLLIAASSNGLSEKKEGKQNFFCFPSRRVVPSGFEPEQTEPKSVVLPLHHGTIRFLRNEAQR